MNLSDSKPPHPLWRPKNDLFIDSAESAGRPAKDKCGENTEVYQEVIGWY
jgi:hypothetical protein